jgi:hypothetical protein
MMTLQPILLERALPFISSTASLDSYMFLDDGTQLLIKEPAVQCD